ncbi:phage tail protein [Laribacter hongkongensis]|uniref:phage tail protein n=1 Tax=Laribacter hongkongensis TaxID=168471 RepID=UPI001EFE8819|nr:phage tail protein [Laribacter hongkongensis]MCG8998436.1 phage tail protein [Laribacter hongkongensis]MCG9013605.1 phage tail protein [Laribacter hongkongensis]MCG9043956.1 phage tail protein [Laribacter hongkongensis]
MPANYYCLLTRVGEAKLAKATALGARLAITHLAVGDGGGSVPQPEPDQTALKHEVRRGLVNELKVDPLNANQIIIEQVIPEEAGGWWIREVGAFDADGDLIAVGNCPESYKPVLAEGSGRTQIIRMVLIVSSTDAVTLKIDPSVVLATKQHVTETVAKAISDHAAQPDPHPQYATDEALTQGLAGKLGKTETAADSARLGGKLPGSYVTADSVLLPLASIPAPCVSTSDSRLDVTPAAVAGQGGTVFVPAGVLISIGQEVVTGKLGRQRAFTTEAFTSPNLVANSEYYIRAQVVDGALTFYVTRGLLTDVEPASQKGTINGVAGGGFPSTPIDICIARVLTGAAGSVPVVQRIINRQRLSWTVTLNGTGLLYLPLDPHTRTARITAANPTPHPTALTFIGHGSSGWQGANYGYIAPNTQAAISTSLAWNGSSTIIIMSSGEVGDMTISTSAAQFDHMNTKSLWQVFQTEHRQGDTSTISTSDELLLGMGIKTLTPADYANGLAINYTNCVNAQFSWEIVR